MPPLRKHEFGMFALIQLPASPPTRSRHLLPRRRTISTARRLAATRRQSGRANFASHVAGHADFGRHLIGVASVSMSRCAQRHGCHYPKRGGKNSHAADRSEGHRHVQTSFSTLSMASAAPISWLRFAREMIGSSPQSSVDAAPPPPCVAPARYRTDMAHDGPVSTFRCEWRSPDVCGRRGFFSSYRLRFARPPGAAQILVA